MGAVIGEKLQEAERLIAEHDLSAAATLLHDVCEGDPANAAAWHRLSTVLKELRRPQEALDAALRVTQLAPDFVKAHRRAGLLLTSMGRFAEAEPHLIKAADTPDPDPWVVLSLARCALELNRREEAAAHLAAFRRHWPEPDRKLQSHYGEIARELKPARLVAARYPRYASEFDDLDRVIREYVLNAVEAPGPIFNRHSRVVTLGSCFAGNIARSLQAHDVAAHCFGMAEDFNSTFANAFLFRYLKGNTGDVPPSLAAFASRAAEEMRPHLENADLLIYTLGVAPCFFDRATNELVVAGSDASVLRHRRDQLIARTTTVEENLRNFLEIVQHARSFSPKLKIVYTLSPVPLIASFEMKSAVLADCISKSVLRVTCHEIQQAKLPDVYYWPSFEIVRWLGAHTGPVFGLDGNAHHVDQGLVDRVVRHFITVMGDLD